MLKNLPFNALRTLEAVVRLRGFGRAAEELGVTQSAVSQQVKQLEEWLGHLLMERRAREPMPTEAGAHLARAVRDGFGAIEVICDDLRNARKQRKHDVLVAAPPGFAFVWLLPRLLGFDEQNPGFPISLSTDPASRQPDRGAADVVIAYGAGSFSGLHAELLMTEDMSPVCAPGLAQSLRSVADLPGQMILEDELDAADNLSNWDHWAKELGITLPHFPHTRSFGQANLVVQATIGGHGVAMGRRPLVEDAVQSGALVYPFADEQGPRFARSQSSYWFVCPHEALRADPVRAFRDWLHAETAVYR